MSGALERARRAFDALVLGRVRRGRDRLVERTPPMAERLYRTADSVAHHPFRAEANELPPALGIGGVYLDVVADLVEYSRLPRATVEHELRTRFGLNFRGEWLATQGPLRHDHWFYLSSKAYLFANATHFADTSFAERFVKPYIGPDGRVLDFGGGTGNLALGIAALGVNVWVTEVNALQRDFIRFRVARHGLADMVTVTDPWSDLPHHAFDAVVAVDVLEHLPDCREVLERELIPALAPKGALVENSPFVVSSANPMHHEDFGLEPYMQGAGFTVAAHGDDGTRVWRRGE
jgi:SAM-dependent methyltransferase